MKKIIIVFFLLAACMHIQAQDLTWDINFQKGRDLESVPVSQIIRMQTGEIFQFSVLPSSNAYCYIVCYDSQRNVAVLFNQLLSAKQEKIFGPLEITEPAGTETIYVILSLDRQTNLDRLILELNNNPGSRQAGNNLYREVVSVQNNVSRLGEPASSYIPSGGTTRGNTAPQHITRFSGKDLYVRAIAIRH